MNFYHYLSLFAILYSATSAYALEINHVYHQPTIFNPQKSETMQVHFSLSEDATVQLNIYDDRDILIKAINAPALKAGERNITWDGMDDTGQHVPPEAYRYTLEARNSYHEVIEHDLSDHTGGEIIHIKDVKWDSNKMQFEYILHEPARIMIRVGLEGHGPLLVNILNWVPRTTGRHKESWDGDDASHVLNLARHPKLKIDIQAYALSNNTIIVGPYTTTANYIDTKSSFQLRTKKKIKKKRMVSAYQQIPEQRGDYLAKLELPSNYTKTKNNALVVSGEVAILLSVDDSNKKVALNQRTEPVFFVDGQFFYENEVGFLPMTWLLDTSKLNEGEHFLTANIRGYEGNFGLATTKIYVERNK